MDATRKIVRTFGAAGMAAALLIAPGCKQYSIDVTVKPDGTGERDVRLEMKSLNEADLEIGLEEFTALFGLESSKGWRLGIEPAEQAQLASKTVAMKSEASRERKDVPPAAGDTVFHWRRSAGSPGDWARMSNTLRVRGSLDGESAGKVEMTNDIDMETGEDPSGRTYTYTETLRWTALEETLVEFYADLVISRLVQSYPDLDERDRRELRGLWAGGLTQRFEELAESEDSDNEIRLFASSIAPYAREIVSRRHPGATDDEIAELAAQRLIESDAELDAFLLERLPGVYLAAHTSISFSLTMPGRIIDSNATEVSDNRATWDVHMMDGLFKPIRIYAKSELPR